MTTDKQRLIRAGWINLVQDVESGYWHGLHRGQGGYWLGHNLLGKRRDEWVHDDDIDRALRFLAGVHAANKAAATAANYTVWGDA